MSPSNIKSKFLKSDNWSKAKKSRLSYFEMFHKVNTYKCNTIERIWTLLCNQCNMKSLEWHSCEKWQSYRRDFERLQMKYGWIIIIWFIFILCFIIFLFIILSYITSWWHFALPPLVQSSAMPPPLKALPLCFPLEKGRHPRDISQTWHKQLQ